MKDRTILENARNMLLITAGSFCLSAAANALPQEGRQEHNLRPSSSERCESKTSAKEEEQRQRSARLFVITQQA
jgi:hypothetical protein